MTALRDHTFTPQVEPRAGVGKLFDSRATMGSKI